MKQLFLFLFILSINLQLSAQNKVIKTYENGNTYIEGQTTESVYSENDEFYIDEAKKATDTQLKVGDNAPLKDGKWTFYYENGSIQTIAFYNKGKRTGSWVSYHSNKQISSTENYITGEAVYYLANGKKFQEGKISTLGLKHGKWQFWDKEGNKTEKNYINGLEIK